MHWWSGSVSDCRAARKCCALPGWQFVVLALALALPFQTATNAQELPPDELYDGIEATDEYPDVDNVEWHHVKVVDGIMQEDHPVIMYKEDFVSEDYDPNKNRTHGSRPHKIRNAEQRRQRRLNRTNTEKYHAVKPEKIYFDVLSQTPLVVPDDASTNDPKFDTSKIRVEVIPLDGEADESAKQLLNKRPKKYRHRQRRDTAEHVVQKRNPYYQYSSSSTSNSYLAPATANNAVYYTPRKSNIAGKFWNAIHVIVPPAPEMPVSVDERFGAKDEPDRVIWPSRNRFRTGVTTPRRQQPTTARPPPSIFHNSNPDNADTSFLNRIPATERPAPPIFHNSDPNNADLSFFQTQTTTTRRPMRTTTSTPPARAPAAQGPTRQITPCVWAIVNCCQASSEDIRYSCFERIGCHGAFWDLNPCADIVRDRVLESVSDFLG